jgi:uncharacterized protein
MTIISSLIDGSESEVYTGRIPAGGGVALEVAAGEVFRIEDLEGRQACDLVAFVADDRWDRLSVALTRTLKRSTRLSAGDLLRSNRGTPMLTILEDSRSTNDALFASCNRWLYENHFGQLRRRGCFELLREALSPYGVSDEMIPDPFNLFTHSAVIDGQMTFLQPLTRAGDQVELRAECDCLLGLTSCPEDISVVNDRRITPIGFRRLSHSD